MLIPISTEYRPRSTPVINYAIIAINILVFLPKLKFAQYEGTISPFMLDPLSPSVSQFFTSMFLHANGVHLFGNMVFLWVFGNAVNDRLGHVAYAAFYLAGGVLSGIGYVLLSGDVPVLGASGAISGVTGCYLVLLPRVRVTVLAFLLFVLWPLKIPSLVFLGMQFAFNFWSSLAGQGGGVAYVAHAAGYVYGFCIAMALLALRVLPRDVYDLLSLWKAQRRRSTYRRMVARGHDPFSFQPSRRPAPKRSAARSRREQPDTVVGDAAESAMELRQQISQAHGNGDLPGAAGKYLDLVGLGEDAVLPRQIQLDVSNHLMSDQRYNQAADAYERFVKHYPDYEHTSDIRLMLGIIYGRYLQQRDRARENLRLAIAGLHDANKLAMARAEMEALGRP